MGFDRITASEDDSERFARLRLSRSARVGPVNFARLMERFGTARAALKALPDVVRKTGGSFSPAAEARVQQEWDQGHALGARLLIMGDTDYPVLLRQAEGAPPALWALGPLTPQRRTVAIVGARSASAAGQRMAEILARQLGEQGFHIVSGMARGVDTRAHEAALGSGTIAVLGGGIDDIYPDDNAPLYERLRAQGLILSESPPGYRAQARDFPRRNRIISCLSLATVVAEAELRSGSLITARLALEQNREVFAVPGSPLDPRARGGNDLIRNGANLCESAEDVLRVLEAQMGFEAPVAAPFATASATPPDHDPDLAPTEADAADPFRRPDAETEIERLSRRLLALIGPSPTPTDELLRLAGVQVSVARAALGLAALSELEIAGLITAHGGQYSRCV